MIDWSFLAACEGGQRLHGYVPQSKGDKSGVTIAMGIDLGYYAAADLAALPQALRARLQPYLGKTGAAARQWLAMMPLTVTKEEADLIERPKRDEMQAALSLQYLRAAGTPFESIPDAAQTVLMSVTWQYGTPWSRCPRFWKAACARDWTAVIAELRAFGDDYPARRHAEADYLKNGLK